MKRDDSSLKAGDVWVHHNSGTPYYVEAVSKCIKLGWWWVGIRIVTYVPLENPDAPEGPFSRLEYQFRRSFFKV